MSKLKNYVKVVCHKCFNMGRIDEFHTLENPSKEVLEILQNAKTCEKCGYVFKNEDEKVLDTSNL